MDHIGLLVNDYSCNSFIVFNSWSYNWIYDIQRFPQANYNYEVKIGLNRYRLKFKSKKTGIWNDYDCIGERKYTFIQLEEEEK